jgi:hypothetical protein
LRKPILVRDITKLRIRFKKKKKKKKKKEKKVRNSKNPSQTAFSHRSALPSSMIGRCHLQKPSRQTLEKEQINSLPSGSMLPLRSSLFFPSPLNMQLT